MLKDISSNYTSAGATVVLGPLPEEENHAGQCHIKIFHPRAEAFRIGGVDVKDISKEELMNTVSFVASKQPSGQGFCP